MDPSQISMECLEATHQLCGPCFSCRHITRDDLVESLSIHLSTQAKHMPASDFMEKIQQHEMAPVWRKRICEWMIEAAEEFDMAMDTVACAVNLMDRYLSEFQADKVLLQLLAMVALCVASKMHESHPMTMDEMDLLSRGKFYRRDIRDVEKQLLKIVGWNVNPPTAHTFARELVCFIEDTEVREELMGDVLVVLDQTMKDHTFVKYLPSTVALSGIMVASMRKRRGVNPWITMGVNALAWPCARLRDCQRAILAATPCAVTPIDTEQRSSRVSKMVRSDSPTSVEEFERIVSSTTPMTQHDSIDMCRGGAYNQNTTNNVQVSIHSSSSMVPVPLQASLYANGPGGSTANKNNNKKRIRTE